MYIMCNKIISFRKIMGTLFCQYFIKLNWLLSLNEKNLRMNLRDGII